MATETTRKSKPKDAKAATDAPRRSTKCSAPGPSAMTESTR